MDLHWLDRELEVTATDVRSRVKLRLITIACFGGIFASIVNWQAGAVWAGVSCCSLAWDYAESGARRADRPLVAWRLSRIAGIVFGSAVWTALPLAFWLSGDLGRSDDLGFL